MLKDEEKTQIELEENLLKISRSFVHTISEKTSDISNFPSIDEIESMLNSSLEKTKLQYLDSVRDCLSSVDEAQVIKLKKKNTQKGE